MRLRLVEGAAAMAELRAPWQSLQALAEPANLFLTYEWLKSWCETLGAEASPYLLLVEGEQGVLGLAPLARVARPSARGAPPLRVLRWMGTGDAACPEHLEPLALPGQRQAVARAVAEHLRAARGTWDLLLLSDTRASAPLLPALHAALRGPAFCWEAPGATSPYLPLPGDWEQLLAGQSRNFRQGVRRKRRRWEAPPLGGTLRPASSAGEIEAALEKLFSWNAARWAAAGEVSAFGEARFQAFKRAVVQRARAAGWLELLCLEGGGACAAVLLGYAFRGTFSFYNTAYDPALAEHSPGAILLAWSIQRALEQGLTEYDFLRGLYPYKLEWSEHTRSTVDFYAARPSPLPLLWASAWHGRALLRHARRRLRARHR